MFPRDVLLTLVNLDTGDGDKPNSLPKRTCSLLDSNSGLRVFDLYGRCLFDRVLAFTEIDLSKRLPRTSKMVP